jgi:hypothetical protein
LSALLSETTPEVSEDLKEIDIDLIEPNNLQPRTRFDEAQLEELALSIRENGIVQPILVRRTTEDGGLPNEQASRKFLPSFVMFLMTKCWSWH